MKQNEHQYFVKSVIYEMKICTLGNENLEFF